MLRFHRLSLMIAVLLLGSAAWTAENDKPEASWPQWRGPHRDGISADTGLLGEWAKAGPPLVWKSAGLGSGYSSVAIDGGRIFTMGKRDGGEMLIALDAGDGHELWAARVSTAGGDGPRCTPTVEAGRVWAIGREGDLVCVEAATGKEVWRKKFSKDFGGKMMSGWGFCESPLIDGDRLICTPGGKKATLVALDKQTGELIWKAAVPKIGDRGGDGAGYSSIVISQAAGVKQYVQLLGRGCVGVAADDGRFLWGYNRIANGTANIPTPIVVDDYVFCSTGYGTGAALLKLQRDGDGVSAEEVYFLNAKELQNHHGGLVLVGDYIYGGHGHNNGFPFCLELKTGKMVWRKDRGPGTGSAAVCCADGQLYFRYQNGLMALIDATKEGYALHGSFQIPDVSHPSWAHPVVIGGKLYLREQDQLFVYNVSK